MVLPARDIFPFAAFIFPEAKLMVPSVVVVALPPKTPALSIVTVPPVKETFPPVSERV